MWLGKQQKAPVRGGGGQTGVVTMGGEDLAVRLDCEVRAPVVYGPAGYRWTPGTGDKVLVIKGEGEHPCVVGVKDGGDPAQITIRAARVELEGEILVNGTPLEQYIRALAAQAAGGAV